MAIATNDSAQRVSDTGNVDGSTHEDKTVIYYAAACNCRTFELLRTAG